MTIKAATVTVLLIFFPVSISATIIHVPADYPTIQQGINASVDGDTVLVQPGTYYENINFNGHNIVLGSLFLTTGNTSYIEQTVIDGNNQWDAVVTFWTGNDSTAAIIGFTIQNGLGCDLGAGIYCLYSNPIIKYNIIRNNNMSGDEAGCYGAGISCLESNPTITNNLIINNEAHNWLAGAFGGAIAVVRSDAVIQNNTIYGNYAYGYGGGIYGYGPSNPVIRNNILWGDSADYANTNEISFRSGCTPSITYCDIQDTLCPGSGNMSVPPVFRDTVNGDFHLISADCGDPFDSPCIDAGDPNILDSLLDCSWGLGGSRSDMGAYGGGDTAYVAIWDVPSTMPDRFMLLQNYPNPFNAQTIIRFNLPKAGKVELSVYDLLGRQIEILIDEHMEAGSHNIEFDASSLPSGFYFYRLRVGDAVETKRMVLLK